MRSTYFFGFLFAGSVAAAAVGCGDDSNNNTGGAGGTGSGSSTTSSGATTSGGPTSTSSTGPAADGDDTFETAKEFELGTEVDGAIDPVESDVDYYKFTGTAGQQLILQVTAKPDANPEDETYIDPVVTLFDENKQQIAQNDDPRPRFGQDSQLFTVLPADGTYYVQVNTCNGAFPGECNGDLSKVLDPSYKLFVGGINPAILVSETPGETTDFGAYTQQNNFWTQKLVVGDFSATDETDVYSFTLPAIEADAGTRVGTLLSFFPSGKDWSGASTDIQLATLKDSTGAVIAQLDPSLSGVSPVDELAIDVPLTPEASYTLELAHKSGDLGGNPFYYVFHFPEFSTSPLEAADATNDTTPEALTARPNADGSTSFFVTGNVNVAGGDVDRYSFAIPAGQNKITTSCSSWTLGAGVRDLTASILTSAGAPVPSGVSTETEQKSAGVDDIAAPAGTSGLLQVSALTQDAVVTGDYYRCVVIVSPAQP